MILPWWSLDLRLRSLVLALGFVLATVATVLLGLRGTPYVFLYPYLMVAIWFSTFMQGYALVLLEIGTTLGLLLWPPIQLGRQVLLTPLAQVLAGEVFVALSAVGFSLIVAQRRSEQMDVSAAQFEVGLLRALGTYALARLDQPSLLRTLVSYLVSTLDADRALILLPDRERTALHGYLAHGDGRTPEPVERPLAGSVAGDIFTSGKTRIIEDAGTDARLAQVLNGDSAVGVPLVLGGLVIGVLYVGREKARPFSAYDLRQIEAVARAIAVPLYASAASGAQGTPGSADRGGTERAEAGGSAAP
jgi:hypothetical protein